MRAIFILVAATALTGCASQDIQVQDPVWISSKINGLQGSPCQCGGLETEEEHEDREKRKKEAARSGEINTDIVQGPY